MWLVGARAPSAMLSQSCWVSISRYFSTIVFQASLFNRSSPRASPGGAFPRISYCLRTRTSLILMGGTTTRTSTRSLSLAVFCNSSALMRKFCCSSSLRMSRLLFERKTWPVCWYDM